MKKILIILLALLLLAGCSNKKDQTVIDHEVITPEVDETENEYLEEDDEESNDGNPIVIIQPEIIEEVVDNSLPKNANEIVIIYTSDMHGSLDGKISYSNIKAYKDELIAQGKKVILVDDGDIIQGGKNVNYDEGHNIINIMNEVGYDYITLGNHDFAYGPQRLEDLKTEGKFKILAMNIFYSKDNTSVFQPYEIINAAGMKIAIIGISFPSIDPNFKGSYKVDGGGLIYNLIPKTQMHDSLQDTIDVVRDKVDYVVVISHVAGDQKSNSSRAARIIQNTSGIDVFLAGHSHLEVESRFIKDKDGNDVLLSVPGGHGSCFGVLTITKDGLSAELIRKYGKADEYISALEEEARHPFRKDKK